MRAAESPELGIQVASQVHLDFLVANIAAREKIRFRSLKSRSEIWMFFETHEKRLEILRMLVDAIIRYSIDIHFAEITTGTHGRIYIDDADDMPFLLAAAEDRWAKCS